MTLRELINSVDAEQYSDSPLFLQLTQTKPEYGASRHIQVTEALPNTTLRLGLEKSTLIGYKKYTKQINRNL